MAFLRKPALLALTACLALAFGATDAAAKAVHHKHKAKHHVTHHAVKSHGNSIVRIAQDHLTALGYYNGKVDGIMGPQTRAAIKKFQREHGLKADGVLGPKTRKALDDADHRVIGSRSVPIGHENPTVNQNYATSMNEGTRTAASRFAHVDIKENGNGYDKRYFVNVNGQAVLLADGQPSVIGVSETYDLGNEDAIIFTTYSPNASNCVYSNHVLAMDSSGNQLLDIENCTREVSGQVVNGSLYISFPEPGADRAIGATWRLQGMSLQKL